MSTALLGVAMVLAWLLRKARDRWPELTKAQMWGIISAGALAFFIGEPLFLIPMEVWTYPGTPISVRLGGEAARYPFFPELLVASAFLALPAGLRYFKDDRGRTIVERGLEQHGPKVRKLIILLSLYVLAHINLIVVATMPLWPLSFHQQEWATLPPSMNVGVCDQPGIAENTVYGPCPGSPGFRMPISQNANLN
jgi:Spirocyclase AveC-like